ncbi:rhodanese-like domain-containing protein, partial [uncultured Bradyrhizobium sp.]|uniref:rhodanese-like domain-containing protein n=1 Tax=uncultured Bradyrhizobium sp. TaxID=199684 RepID=UPI002602CE8A
MADYGELITTAELAEILTRPELRLFDCTTYLEPAPAGSNIPYIVVSGRQTFEAGHIPGANFLDLQAEFSDARTELRFMMPPTAQLEAAFGRHGISASSRVVLYSIGTAMWATRFWWMLRSLGFESHQVKKAAYDAARRRPEPAKLEPGAPAASETPAPDANAGP